MTDIAQIKAQLMQVSSKLGEAAGVLQHGSSLAEEAQQMLHGAMEGTSQSDYDECQGLISDAMGKAEDAQKSASRAADGAESMAARL